MSSPELASVKAAVKAWEKAFRSRERREPTKDDIKRDPGDIAQQYAIYRKLSKSSGSSQSQPHLSRLPSSASTSTSSSSRRGDGEPSRSTPRTIPNSEYPTTPTPPARRYSLSRPASAMSQREDEIVAGPSRLSIDAGSTLKRKASKVALNGDPDPRPVNPAAPPLPAAIALTTPKKRPTYSGPIYDPNPVNPFSVSPAKYTSPFTSRPEQNPHFGAAVPTSSMSSPFIHASSPRRLREVLEANSLKKVRERLGREGEGQGSPTKQKGGMGMGITPRTRARKRLRGEMVEDTPMKEKVPRRRRGEGRDVSKTEAPNASGIMVDQDDDLAVQDTNGVSRNQFGNARSDGVDEDEFGPSPYKVADGKAFTALLAEKGDHSGREGPSGKPDKGKARATTDTRTGKSNGANGLFSRFGVAKSHEQNDRANGKGKERASARDSLEQAANHVSNTTMLSARDLVPSSPEADEPRGSSTYPGGEGAGEENPFLATISIDPDPTSSSPDAERLPTPSPDDVKGAALSQTTPSRKRAPKVVTIEEDEVDEWDPESGVVKRELVILPTRRNVRRTKGSSDLEDEPETVDDSEDDEIPEGGTSAAAKLAMAERVEADAEGRDGDQEEDPGQALGASRSTDDDAPPPLAYDGTTLSSALPSSPAPSNRLDPPRLHLLSLHSPSQARTARAQARAADLRVKAIFDPLEAARLKALRKGQEVYESGEGGAGDEAEDEEGVLARFGSGRAGGLGKGTSGGGSDERIPEGWGKEADDGAGDDAFADDDWESENEGWKRAAVAMDDGEVW